MSTENNIELPEPLDVIAVGAHPDDLEIACGGTLAALVRQGYRVGMIDLTNGEPTPLSESPQQRLAEADAAAKTLGVQVRRILEFQNRRLFDGFEVRVELAKLFRTYRPKIVIGFGDKTPLASPDHYQAMLITDAAVFYSRLTKWEHHFDHLPVHTISKQLYFRLPFEPQTLPGCTSHFTVDITETLEQKIDSIKCYATQFPDSKQSIFDRVSAAAILNGSAAGYGAGEVFASTRPIGIKNMVETLL